MIPKKIHYCWFGKNKLPDKAYCPDYEIIEWNEDNFDVRQNGYTEFTYDNRKFAFLSDYARLQIVLKEGGLYFDVDVEIIRPLDELLVHKAFFGFETEEYVNTGVGFGAEANNLIVAGMLREYDILLDGKHGTIGCPLLNTQALMKYGLKQNGMKQTIDGAMIYPIQYFNPYDDPTGILNTTEETVSIHWYAKSWMDKKTIIRSKLTKPIHRLLGTEFFKKRK